MSEQAPMAAVLDEMPRPRPSGLIPLVSCLLPLRFNPLRTPRHLACMSLSKTLGRAILYDFTRTSVVKGSIAGTNVAVLFRFTGAISAEA